MRALNTWIANSEHLHLKSRAATEERSITEIVRDLIRADMSRTRGSLPTGSTEPAEATSDASPFASWQTSRGECVSVGDAAPSLRCVSSGTQEPTSILLGGDRCQVKVGGQRR